MIRKSDSSLKPDSAEKTLSGWIKKLGLTPLLHLLAPKGPPVVAQGDIQPSPARLDVTLGHAANTCPALKGRPERLSSRPLNPGRRFSPGVRLAPLWPTLPAGDLRNSRIGRAGWSRAKVPHERKLRSALRGEHSWECSTQGDAQPRRNSAGDTLGYYQRPLQGQEVQQRSQAHFLNPPGKGFSAESKPIACTWGRSAYAMEL